MARPKKQVSTERHPDFLIPDDLEGRMPYPSRVFPGRRCAGVPAVQSSGRCFAGRDRTHLFGFRSRPRRTSPSRTFLPVLGHTYRSLHGRPRARANWMRPRFESLRYPNHRPLGFALVSPNPCHANALDPPFPSLVSSPVRIGVPVPNQY
jgi:hypothetical protein